MSFTYEKLIIWPTVATQQLQVRFEQEYSKYYSKEIKFAWAALTISIKSRLTVANIGSIGVRADSIHVTIVISLTFVNIWETIETFAFYFVCVSRIRYLIFETYFSSRIFQFINLIYQLWKNWLIPAAPKKRYLYPWGLSRHKKLNQIAV